jgi:hypothetical protein
VTKQGLFTSEGTDLLFVPFTPKTKEVLDIAYVVPLKGDSPK